MRFENVPVFPLLIISILECAVSIRLGLLSFTQDSLFYILPRAIALNISLFVAWTLWIYPRFFNPLRHLPGPSGGLGIIGYGFERFRQPPSLRYLEWMKEYPNDGLIKHGSFFGSYRLLPTSPKALSDLLVTKTYDFVKPAPGRRNLQAVLGNGLVVVEQDEHKFQRKNLMPSFSFRHIKEQYPLMWAKALELVQYVGAEIDASVTGEAVVEVNQWSTRATLDIIGVAALGKDFHALRQVDDELAQTYEWIFQPDMRRMTWFIMRMIFPVMLANLLIWNVNQEVVAQTRKLREISRRLIADKKESIKLDGTEQTDTLATLMRSNNFSDDELVDQLLTFLAAGHETTSSSFTWILYLLSTHPQWQTRLRAELHTAFHGRALSATDPRELPAVLETLPVLNACIMETLRLYPTVPVTLREAIRDTSVAGVAIPAGTQLVLQAYSFHRAPHVWGPAATHFDPGRWIDTDARSGAAKHNNHGGAASNFALLTFLHGPRACIGQGFARAELRVLTAAFVSAFEMALADPAEKIEPFGMVTIKPKDGLRLRLRRARAE